MRNGFGILLIAALPCALSAQTAPDVKTLLTKVSNTYGKVRQYEIVANVTTTDQGQTVTGQSHVALRAPDRYRMEYPAPPGPDGSAGTGTIIVFDGKALWIYDPAKSQYASYPANVIGKSLSQELEVEGVDFGAIGRFRQAVNQTPYARWIRDEQIAVNGVKADCSVVAFRSQVPVMWWIEKKTGRVLREESGSQHIVFTTIRLDEALPDSLFRFDPPAGAVKNNR